jgi:oligoendopeptidase F
LRLTANGNDDGFRTTDLIAEAMSSVPERSDIAKEYTWDLTDLFADDDAWEDAYEAVEERLEELEAYEGRVTEDAETLSEVLNLRESIMREVSNVAAYARMRKDEDTTNQQYQALAARAQSLAADASSAASFIEPELQELDRERIDTFIEENPDLVEYDHYFEDVLRMKPHTRSAEIEELLADLSEVTGAAGDVYNMLTNADMEFPSVDIDGEPQRITLSNFTKLQKHPDRDVRRRVYEAFYDEWGEYRNSIGTAYKNSVKADSKLAAARNYDTAREAALDGPNVPAEVYDTLVDTVESNLDVLHGHAELKRDCLGVDELKMWDLYAPLSGSESLDLEYEDAREYVIDAVEPLGDAYQERMAEGLQSRWVDVYETANKQSGAYSGGTYDSQPYILMNYQDDIASMYTLAHELGHSMHSELTSEEQPYVYSGYEIFVAEVASTVNEALLTHHLLETVEDEAFRRHVIDEYLERFRSTLFRQTMFASFEHRAHELSEAGEALTPDRLDDIYHGLKRDYYESADVDDRIAREWMRIPHFYRAYYVYQYATGISAANAIVDRIHEEGETAAADYREFLQSGSRGYPLELLKIAGIDMSSPGPVESAIGTYDEMVAEYERLR